jgi:hypothetical protein
LDIVCTDVVWNNFDIAGTVIASAQSDIPAVHTKHGSLSTRLNLSAKFAKVVGPTVTPFST